MAEITEAFRNVLGVALQFSIPPESIGCVECWRPATIIDLPRQHTAKVKVEDRSIKELHFNNLRPYIARVEQIRLIFD